MLAHLNEALNTSLSAILQRFLLLSPFSVKIFFIFFLPLHGELHFFLYCIALHREMKSGGSKTEFKWYK